MTTKPDRVLYLDGASQPITFPHLDEQLAEASDAFQASLMIVNGLRNQEYDDDRAMILAVKAILEYGLKTVENLIPDGIRQGYADDE